MEELIQRFNDHGVRYLLIGGQAMRLHGMPRYSMDWDLFVPGKDLENIAKINQLMDDELDIPVIPLGPKGENFVQTYQTSWGVVQFHLAPVGIPRFDEAESASIVIKSSSGVQIRCVCGDHLLRSKKAAGRPEDQADIRFLDKKKDLGKL